MTRRNRRIPAPPRPTIRHKAKDEFPFEKLLEEIKKQDLSQTDVHAIMGYLYDRYEGEYRYYNRLLKDKGKMIV